MRVGYRTGDMWAPQARGDRGAARRGRAFRRLHPDRQHAAHRRPARAARGRADRGRQQLDAPQGRNRLSRQDPGGACRDSVRRSESPVPQHQDRGRCRHPEACSTAASSRSAAKWPHSRREFAAYCSSPHGIGVNTGTSALHLALLAAGIGRGDEVITVPFTFVATVVGDRLHRRDAGVRRYRSGDLHDGPGQASRRRSPRAPRPSSRCTCTASRPTWIRSSRSRAATAWS